MLDFATASILLWTKFQKRMWQLGVSDVQLRYLNILLFIASIDKTSNFKITKILQTANRKNIVLTTHSFE